MRKNWTIGAVRATRGQMLRALGLSHSQLYQYSGQCKSCRLEDIKLFIDRKTKAKLETKILWDGEYVTLRQLAKISGIEYATLVNRMRRYGPDCDKTYFPGRIPQSHRLPAGWAAKSYKTKKPHESEWDRLGKLPRGKRLAEIKVGSWEARNA